MLYAVSLETTQVLPVGRVRRVSRVFVDAPNGDEAGRLAQRRFRRRPEIKSCVVRGIARMEAAPPPQADDRCAIDMRGVLKAARRKRRPVLKGIEKS